jgi:hypothetical protein
LAVARPEVFLAELALLVFLEVAFFAVDLAAVRGLVGFLAGLMGAGR